MDIPKEVDVSNPEAFARDWGSFLGRCRVSIQAIRSSWTLRLAASKYWRRSCSWASVSAMPAVYHGDAAASPGRFRCGELV